MTTEHLPNRAVVSPASSAALDQLWTEHRRWVAAILLAHKPRWADLDDLLQDVAATFVANVDALRDPAALRPWLRTVAVNSARLAARRGQLRRHETLDPHADSDHVSAPPPERALAQDQEAEQLLDLTAQLDDAYREPLLLKAVQGLSYRQIGQILALPETTVETRIARARKQLRDLATKTASAPPASRSERAPAAPELQPAPHTGR